MRTTTRIMRTNQSQTIHKSPESILELTFESFSNSTNLDDVRKEIEGTTLEFHFAGNCVASNNNDSCNLESNKKDAQSALQIETKDQGPVKTIGDN